MKYYINVTEISKVYTQWEVDADSYEAAVEKLMDARSDNSEVGDTMLSGCEDFDLETERAEKPCQPYILAEFEEESR